MQRATEEHRDMFLSTSDYAKQNGCIHHEFWAGDGDVVAVDEWESPEAFQAFWDSQGQNIGQLMGAAGAGQPDEPRFYRKLDLGDAF
jgi:heme-degrading monooxygenase HmoA